MNRNQIFTTIEFINDTIRMCIGEYYNEKFYVFDTFKCKCNGLQDSKITDSEEVKKVVSELLELIKNKVEIIVEKLILCLPSNELIINDFTSTSPVTGQNNLISQYDINEAYRVASKIRHQDNEIIINIAPLEYILDDGQKMDFAPLRYKSTTFKTLFNVFMLPKDVYDSYVNCINECGLKVDRIYLDVECLYSGVFEEDDISGAILNVTSNYSDLLVYKKGKLLAKYTTNFGISMIEKELEEQLHVENASNVVFNIGSCKNDNSAHVSVCKSKDNKYISEKEINNIITLNLELILNKLFNKAKENVNFNDLDVYVVGSISKIKEIDSWINKLYNCNVIVFNSNTLGLNDSVYCQTIGLIKLNYKKISQNKYINLQNNNYNDIITNKDKSSKFDKFILDEEDLD